MFRFSVRPNRAHMIDWREWGEDAFEEARGQDKLVVLFIAAFWCGFCQRMDETALSNDETIALLNAFFIPIRVEESQRPDVDLRYNQDGWPTIAVLTPDGGHLFTVNYMDTDPFVDLLVKTVTQFQSDKEGLMAAATYPALAAPQDGTEPPALSPELVGEIAGMVEGMADHEHGGYGTHFKFLHTEANEFLLYLYETGGESTYLDHVTFTLDKMLQSLTFHAKDGGFYRYSSQPDWNEPHPEKLLEDQATLVSNFLRLYLITGDPARRESAPPTSSTFTTAGTGEARTTGRCPAPPSRPTSCTGTDRCPRRNPDRVRPRPSRSSHSIPPTPCRPWEGESPRSTHS